MADDKGLPHQLNDLNEREALHEISGFQTGAITEVALGLILLTAVSSFVLFGLFPHFEIRVHANQAPSAGASADERKLPPEPRLQEDAVRDLQRMRAAEDRTLNSYGWIDQKKGVVRIPIDRAIDLLAQRGLPGRTAHGSPDHAGIPPKERPRAGVQPQGGPPPDQPASGRP